MLVNDSVGILEMQNRLVIILHQVASLTLIIGSLQISSLKLKDLCSQGKCHSYYVYNRRGLVYFVARSLIKRKKYFVARSKSIRIRVTENYCHIRLYFK